MPFLSAQDSKTPLVVRMEYDYCEKIPHFCISHIESHGIVILASVSQWTIPLFVCPQVRKCTHLLTTNAVAQFRAIYKSKIPLYQPLVEFIPKRVA